MLRRLAYGALAALLFVSPLAADSFQSVPLGAYTTYTPTPAAPSASGATFGSTGGRWQIIGKLVCMTAFTTVTAAGTGGNLITLSLPVTSGPGNNYLNGSREAVGGELLKVGFGAGSTVATISLYNNTSALATGAVVYISGCYEAQ